MYDDQFGYAQSDATAGVLPRRAKLAHTVTGPHALILALSSLVLVAVSVEDLRAYRVRNVYVVALTILFFALSLVDGAGQRILWHALFGTLALALLAGAFAAGLIGAGDAKLLAACCLWVGPEGAVVFAASLFVSCLLYGIGATLRLLPARRTDGRTRIPMGPSIAGAWFATLALATFV